MKNLKNKYNIGIIGCGRVAEHYYKILKLIKKPKISVLAVCDKNTKKAKKFAKQYKSKVFKNFGNMLNQNNFDLVVILTPSGLHYKHTKMALGKGFNVLVEKPIALIPKQASELYKISRKKKLFLGVGFQNRYNKAILFLKKAIRENKFGKIITVSVVLRWCRFQKYYEDEWHGSWKNDGGVISQQAIHHVDVLNTLLGPIKSVSSISTRRLNKLEAEDTLVSIMKLKKGGLCTIEATTAARPKDFEASITVVGEKGIAKIGGIALNKIEQWDFINKNYNLSLLKKNNSEHVDNGYGFGHKKLLIEYFKELDKNKKNYDQLINSINTTKLIHAIYSSDEKKKNIDLSNNPVSKRLGK